MVLQALHKIVKLSTDFIASKIGTVLSLLLSVLGILMTCTGEHLYLFKDLFSVVSVQPFFKTCYLLCFVDIAFKLVNYVKTTI